ncbi:swarming motility protein ybiA, partial [Trifolium medium]|nr:swarming motility protein ybiA [Trifolium medium]
MMVVGLAMRGCAVKWWLWWCHRHPKSNWDTFIIALL